MTNEQLIKKRWKYTDELLRVYEKKFKAIFSDIKDELIELFEELDIKREDLTKTVPNPVRRKLDRKIKEWKNDGLLVGYFDYLVKTTTKFTYQNVLNLFVYGIYMKYQQQEFDESKNFLVEVANDVYKQAKEEINEVPKNAPDKILWRTINDWLIIQTVNLPLYEYLLLMTQTAQEEAYKTMLNAINQELSLDDRNMSKLIDKQEDRLISINGDKSSGMLENAAIQVGNKAYYMPFQNELIRFVAKMDDRTTKMCMSLNDQIFNTVDVNTFYRYSENSGGDIKYEIDGLVEGINLPPIVDHFHWCRSTMTYDLSMSNNELQKAIFGINIIKGYKKSNELDIEKSYNAKVINESKITAFNGKTYSGDQVKPNSNLKGEEETAYWLKNKFSIDVKLMPEAKENGVKNYDYLFDNSSERWDLKQIEGSSRRVIKNNVDIRQATSYVIDMTNSPLSVKEMEDVISYTFISEKKVNTIILKNDDDLVGVYTNLYK